jgi:hypothetical protein
MSIPSFQFSDRSVNLSDDHNENLAFEASPLSPGGEAPKPDVRTFHLRHATVIGAVRRSEREPDGVSRASIDFVTKTASERHCCVGRKQDNLSPHGRGN